MKIVIDIPEELFGKINDENYQSLISWYDTSLYCAIKDGTPLPKGHGDLIDEKNLLDKWNNLSVRGRTEFDQVIMCQPPVIPADKGE
jgi:hypothetical protein